MRTSPFSWFFHMTFTQELLPINMNPKTLQSRMLIKISHDKVFTRRNFHKSPLDHTTRFVHMSTTNEVVMQTCPTHSILDRILWASSLRRWLDTWLLFFNAIIRGFTFKIFTLPHYMKQPQRLVAREIKWLNHASSFGEGISCQKYTKKLEQSGNCGRWVGYVSIHFIQSHLPFTKSMVGFNTHTRCMVELVTSTQWTLFVPCPLSLSDGRKNKYTC